MTPPADAAGASGGKPDAMPPAATAAITTPPPPTFAENASGAPSEAVQALTSPAAARAPTIPVELRSVGDGSPAAPPSTPPRPAAQIMPALVSLGATPGGGSRLTVQLHPAELGQVRIQIDRTHDAAAAVRVTVERPETLSLLMRDQHDLRRALDQAGVPADGRTLSFQLADQPPSSWGGSSHGGPGQGFAGGGGNDPGQARGGRSTPWQDGAVPGDATAIEGRSAREWARSGLDITA